MEPFIPVKRDYYSHEKATPINARKEPKETQNIQMHSSKPMMQN
jgi:hypothetical protein